MQGRAGAALDSAAVVQVIMKPLLLLRSGQCPNYFRLIRTQKCTPSFIRIAAIV